MRRMLSIAALFFLSGCAALIYETVWFYLVQLVVGASSISVAVLLCAFMGGMALGSWLVPKIAPRAHPFRLVAALEAGIAFFGAAIPIALPFIQRAYLTIAEPGLMSVALRAMVCVIVLTPPTMLMGATLPAIARWWSRDHDAKSVGLLYMANLIGATTGTVLAGFYLLRVFDTVTATSVAVVLNLAVAAGFYWFARNTAIAPGTTTTEPPA